MSSLWTGIVKNFSQLNMRLCSAQIQNSFMRPSINSIHSSATLNAEPLKRKKRLDPAIVRAREDRKRRKLEKSIRKLQKISKQLKPLDEIEVPPVILDDPKVRRRPPVKLDLAEVEHRWRLEKRWAKYQSERVKTEVSVFNTLFNSQKKALDELRHESEELYLAAVAPDESLIPYEAKGPTDTPPLKEYNTPQGDYIDISKDWNAPPS